jgi:hypothetical protein
VAFAAAARDFGRDAMSQQDPLDRFLDLHEAERQALFRFEAFTIGILQAVSGAAVFGILSQFKVLIENAGRVPILKVLSLLMAALVCAVVAALCRYQYKMWGVKKVATDDFDKKLKRKSTENLRIVQMRWLMVASTILIVLAFVTIILALRAQHFTGTPTVEG